jgi:hypothetical protein
LGKAGVRKISGENAKNRKLVKSAKYLSSSNYSKAGVKGLTILAKMKKQKEK